MLFLNKTSPFAEYIFKRLFSFLIQSTLLFLNILVFLSEMCNDLFWNLSNCMLFACS